MLLTKLYPYGQMSPVDINIRLQFKMIQSVNESTNHLKEFGYDQSKSLSEECAWVYLAEDKEVTSNTQA